MAEYEYAHEPGQPQGIAPTKRSNAVKITVNVGAILYGCPDLSMGNHKGLPLLKHHPQATQTLTNNKALHKV